MKYTCFFNLICVFAVTKIQIHYLNKLVLKKIITNNLGSAFCVIYLLLTLIIYTYFNLNNLLFYTLFFLLNGLYSALPFIISACRESLIDKGFPVFLERVLLRVSVGQNLSEAMLGLALSEPLLVQSYYVNIVRALPLSKVQSKPGQFVKYEFYIQELIKISAESYHIESRLQSLVEQLKKHANYRRKSSNILYQPKFQALFMATLYLVLLLVTATHFSLLELKEIILFSFLLNLFGLFILFNMGRFIKWKV